MRRKILLLFVVAAMVFGAFSTTAEPYRAAQAGSDMFFIFSEPDGDILIRFGEDSVPHAALRADEIVSVAELGGEVYFLARENAAWTLYRRGRDRVIKNAYEFTEGAPSALSKYEGRLLLLIDGKLHMIYPDTGILIQLAGAAMQSYALLGDEVVYISDTGVLRRLDLTSGEILTLKKGNVSDMLVSGGNVYFHTDTDKGITRLDIRSGNTDALTDDYDWGFYAIGDEIYVRRAGGLMSIDGEMIYALTDQCEISQLDNGIMIFDPIEITCTIFTGK